MVANKLINIIIIIQTSTQSNTITITFQVNNG